MHKSLTLAALLLIVAVTGCSTSATRELNNKTLVRCPQCGMEFTVEEGMKAYDQHHAP
jgi:DNA-directed RNA polymerase subunit RPC12/RpoP